MKYEDYGLALLSEIVYPIYALILESLITNGE